jgi:YD repeat-containing protein
MLMQYNGKGEMEKSAIDLNGNGTIDDSVDRITKYEYSVADGKIIRTVKTYPENNSTPLVVSVNETDVTGLESWSSSFGRAPAHFQTAYNGGGQRTVTATNPDGSSNIQSYLNGRLATSTHSVLGATGYSYDPHSRLASTSQTTGNGVQATSYSYNSNDALLSTADPAGRASSFTYDSMGRRVRSAIPGRTIFYEYSPTGELVSSYGDETYPTANAYDPQGRLKTLSTYKVFPGGTPDNTNWNYDTQRGFLSSKIYADGKGTAYTYNTDGSLHTRTWARPDNGNPLTTTYSYNNAGDIASGHHRGQAHATDYKKLG